MNFIKQLKHRLAHAIHKINHLACGLDTNIALTFTLCYISISAICLMLYFMYSTRSNTLTTHTFVLTAHFLFVVTIGALMTWQLQMCSMCIYYAYCIDHLS